MAHQRRPNRRQSPTGDKPPQTQLPNSQAVRDFLETWGPYCGAPIEVFRGHLAKLLASGRADIDLDLVMAYRLLYYCHAVSMLPDGAYDELEREARLWAPKEHPIHGLGSDKVDDYDPAVRALAIYIRMRYSKTPPALIDFEEPEDEEFDIVLPTPKTERKGGQYSMPFQ